MKQRLGIAGALLRDPRLLLLDEPTTGLDPAGMRDMRALVHRLAEDGLTVLLSSHLMDEVEDLCDRVAIVTRGPRRLRGRAGRADRRRRPGRYDLRTTDDEAGRRDRRAARSGSRTWPRPRAGSSSPATSAPWPR